MLRRVAVEVGGGLAVVAVLVQVPAAAAEVPRVAVVEGLAEEVQGVAEVMRHLVHDGGMLCVDTWLSLV